MIGLNDDDFISKYCGDIPVISENAAGYLNNAIQSVPRKEENGLRIEIRSNVITKEETRQYSKAIQNHYSNAMTRMTFGMKRILKSAAAMLLFGMVIPAFIITVFIYIKCAMI